MGKTQGTKWTEADYAARGYGRISLRLARERLEQLDALAVEWGCSRAEAIGRLIDEKTAEISKASRQSTPKRKKPVAR